jgi:hypothetical protein
MPSDLIRRRDATKATLAKFGKKGFDWSKGETCIHMARFHLQRMGHKPERLPSIRSALTARRVLNERGWNDCGDVLDAQPGLYRIAPAQMLLGDLAMLPDADGFGAIYVCVDAQKAAGWREDYDGMIILDLDFSQFSGAWRV